MCKKINEVSFGHQEVSSSIWKLSNHIGHIDKVIYKT